MHNEKPKYFAWIITLHRHNSIKWSSIVSCYLLILFNQSSRYRGKVSCNELKDIGTIRNRKNLWKFFVLLRFKIYNEKPQVYKLLNSSLIKNRDYVSE